MARSWRGADGRAGRGAGGGGTRAGDRPPSGRVSVEHVINVLARLNAEPGPPNVADGAAGLTPPLADTGALRPPARAGQRRGDRPCVTSIAELKALRLHGMAGAWADLVEQGSMRRSKSSRWLIEHLLQAETHRPRDALGEPPDERGEVPGAPRPGGLRLRASRRWIASW